MQRKIRVPDEIKNCARELHALKVVSKTTSLRGKRKSTARQLQRDLHSLHALGFDMNEVIKKIRRFKAGQKTPEMKFEKFAELMLHGKNLRGERKHIARSALGGIFRLIQERQSYEIFTKPGIINQELREKKLQEEVREQDRHLRDIAKNG